MKWVRYEFSVFRGLSVCTYSVVNDLSPANASCATRDILLFDRSMRRNRLKFANAFGVISVMKFCSKRLRTRNETNFFFIEMSRTMSRGRWKSVWNWFFFFCMYNVMCRSNHMVISSADNRKQQLDKMVLGEKLTIRLFRLVARMAH